MSPEKALHQYFGFDAFRLGQDRVVQAILDGKDTMVVMPTGGGKSLCFQLPALLLEGVAVVVSPLIALMKDQVDGLEARKIPATFINSSLTPSEQGRRLHELAQGEYKLVYVAPERFRDRRFVDALQAVRISFMAVDEAHCVSMWGHDFRPDYLRIGEALEKLGHPPVSAFTATATPEVRSDILTSLKLRDPQKFVTGFERPNLEFRVSALGKKAEKLAQLSRIISDHKTGIVYCATRKRVEEVAESLKEWDVSCISYHGGMDDTQRQEAQEAFMDKRSDVAVATNAFGMGIDRADMRFVVHFEMPGSIEAYYQEAGRAGRDGLPAICELFYGYRDRQIQEFFIEGSNPSVSLIKQVYSTLRDLAGADNTVAISLNDLTEKLGKRVNGMAVSTAVILLSRQRVIERYDIPGERIRGTRLLQPDLSADQLEIDVATLAEKEQRDRNKLQAVIDYSNASGCRQEWVLRYFGETETRPCRRCDSCHSQQPENIRTPSSEEDLILRKALSGVARMSWREGETEWRPRYGKARIIEMLTGSKRAEIINNQLDQLSTYGILQNEGTAYLKELFTEMERAGLVVRTGGEYPMLTLTPLGDAAMKGQTEVELAWPRRKPSPAAQPKKKKSRAGSKVEVSDEYDPELLDALKDKRQELASKRGVPLWTIFPNSTLEALAAMQPLTKQEALKCPGIGRAKAHTVLKDFLPVIAAHRAGKSG